MSRWFLDASVLLASEDLEDPRRSDALAVLESTARLGTLDLAYYETANVAIKLWSAGSVADRLRDRIAAIALDGGLVRADPALLDATSRIAERHGLSVYDAAYVAAAAQAGATLVSCDVRDLVSRGLAITPGDALPSA